MPNLIFLKAFLFLCYTICFSFREISSWKKRMTWKGDQFWGRRRNGAVEVSFEWIWTHKCQLYFSIPERFLSSVIGLTVLPMLLSPSSAVLFKLPTNHLPALTQKRYRCDALPTELWSLIGSRSSASSIYNHYMKRPRLHSSLGRASHRYHGGHGFESPWSLRMFSGLYL